MHEENDFDKVARTRAILDLDDGQTVDMENKRLADNIDILIRFVLKHLGAECTFIRLGAECTFTRLGTYDRRHSKGHSDASRSPSENSQPLLFSLHLFPEPGSDPKQSKSGLKSRGHERSVSSLLIGGCDRWIVAAPKYVVSLVEWYFLTVGDRHWSLRPPENVDRSEQDGVATQFNVVAGLRSSVWVVLELGWMLQLGVVAVKGCCHDDVLWWVRWFNGGCRMKVVKWNNGFVMKMKGIWDDDF
ncbi:hypothetical protein GQ457_09G020130 [Hibiscus cannabinus]